MKLKKLLPKRDDDKIVNFLATAKASVARNFLGALLLKKGTII